MDEEADPVAGAGRTAQVGSESDLTVGARPHEVEPPARAEDAGAEAGHDDVILDVDRRPVISAEEASRVLGDDRSPAHLLRVYGRSGIRFVTMGKSG